MTRLLGEGRYVVGGMLGMGGMGTVYEAEDLASTSRVAIKMLHAEDQADGIVATHMAREACAGRAIRHPNVVAVLDCGCDDGRPFIVMELALGRTLNIASTEEQMSVRR
ncbi:MAG TPA: protein kinase, partial [Kofleriaceae bacterium]